MTTAIERVPAGRLDQLSGIDFPSPYAVYSSGMGWPSLNAGEEIVIVLVAFWALIVEVGGNAKRNALANRE